MELSASPQEQQHAINKTRDVVTGMLFVGLLFIILGFVTWLSGSLIPFLKIVCGLNNFQALWVTFAFFPYACMAAALFLWYAASGHKIRRWR
jgi:fucose permease